ncbi:MAG: hypothetical protein AAGA85_22515 [Bacteroidota bacterium]
MKQSIGGYIVQLFLIVFSVVLGIFLSERIEESKEQKEAMQLLSRITSEVRENQKLLQEWSPYHAEIAQSLDSLSINEQFIEHFIDDKSALYEAVLTRGTFMGRMPSSDAWDIAKAHPLIVNFDYDQLLILSKIYNQQQSTFEPTDQLIEMFFSPDFNSSEKARPNLEQFRMRMQEIVGREMQLLNYFIEAEGIFKFEDN